MPKDLVIKEGKILETLPNTMFRVQLDPNEGESEGHIILAMVSGKMRRYFIKILPGDRVKIEFSPTEIGRAHI